jgi:hypothetical protein
VSRIQPCTLRARQKNTAHRSALMGVTQATMAKLPPGPPVLGYGISRRIHCTPVSPYSVQSKFTPRWPTFSNTKP